MKKNNYSSAIFLSFVLLTGFTTSTFAQWVKQNIPATKNDITYPLTAGKQGMWMVTASYTLDTIGKPIELIHTKDGGKTYSISTLIQDGRNYVMGVNPVDSVTAYLFNNDYVNGHYLIQKTTNGGQTWQNLPYKPQTYPDVLYFFDKNNGVYIADPDSNGLIIMQTTDAGISFTRIPNSQLPATLPHEVALTDGYKVIKDAIYILTIDYSTFDKSRIWRSVDRGKTWSAPTNWLESTEFHLGSFDFSDNIHGMIMPNVFSSFNYSMFTEDGGITWQKGSILPGEKTFPIANLRGTHTYMALFGDTSRGKLFSAITNDFGKTWNSFKDVAPYTLDDTYGLPINFANLEIVDNHTAWSRFSRLELFRYDSPIPLVPEQPDLDLKLTADTEGLPLYGSIKYTLTVTNRGIAPATGVKINWLPPYKRTNNGVGPYAYQAAYADKGRYDSWNGVWTIDKLDAESSATATFHLFVLDNSKDVIQTAQVTACNERDLDSAPNNMTAMAKEDDEVGYVAPSSFVQNVFTDIRRSASEFTVSPNPVQNVMNIIIYLSDNADWSIRVFNSIGQMVYTQNGQNSRILEIDSQGFESGVYFVEYEVNGERRVEKVLVQH